MNVRFAINDLAYSADLSKGVDISIPLVAGEGRLAAWYVPPISISPVRAEGFVGSVAEGGSVNFRNITFNPHGHGTHTECAGHITREVFSVNQVFDRFHFAAMLHTVVPLQTTEAGNHHHVGDFIITPNMIPDGSLPDAFILRTSPNEADKTTRVYNDTNPPFLLPETALKLVRAGVKHLLLDLPSVDRESDGGVLASHHVFFGVPDKVRHEASITELIYVDSRHPDGLYLLEMQTAPFENDATPSRPVIYPAELV